MQLIVAVDQRFGIGKNGKLLTYLPDDLEFFKQKTLGNIIIMGRKTIDSLPKGKLLPDRETWILTRDVNYSKEGAILFNSVEAIINKIKEEQIDQNRIFVAGGATIYEQFLPYCNTAYITKIQKDFNADIQMVNIHEHPQWTMMNKSELKVCRGYDYYHTTYMKVD